MMRRPAWWLIAAAVTCAITLALMASEFRSQRSELDSLSVRWPYVFGAFLFAVGQVLDYAFGWWWLLTKLERRPIRLGRAASTFAMSWPGRYLPASLPHYAGRLLAAPATGASRGAVAASLVYENLIVLSVGAVGCCISLAIAAIADGISPVWAIPPLLIAPLALGAMHPRVLHLGIRLAARRVRRLENLAGHVLPMREVLAAACIYGFGYVFAGFAFALSLEALGRSAPLPLAMAAYNLAGIASMLAIGVPAGFGVREGVVVALIGGVVSSAVALSAAVLVRLVSIVADATPALVAVIWVAGERMMRARTARPTNPPEVI